MLSITSSGLSSSPTIVSSNPSPPSPSHTSSATAIIGGVLGGAVALLTGLIVAYILYRRRRQSCDIIRDFEVDEFPTEFGPSRKPTISGHASIVATFTSSKTGLSINPPLLSSQPRDKLGPDVNNGTHSLYIINPDMNLRKSAWPPSSKLALYHQEISRELYELEEQTESLYLRKTLGDGGSVSSGNHNFSAHDFHLTAQVADLQREVERLRETLAQAYESGELGPPP